MADLKDELRLVLLAQCDDRQAIEALLLSVQEPLERYIAGLVGRTATDDVLQDFFVRIWRNLKWLHRPELFRPWAWRIASRACFEHLKRERKWRYETETDDLAAVAVAGPPCDLEGLLERVSPASRAVLCCTTDRTSPSSRQRLCWASLPARPSLGSPMG